MRPTRRAFVGGGLAATLWRVAEPASASESRPAQPGTDGFIELRAHPLNWPLAGADAAPSPILAYGEGSPGPLIRLRPGSPLAVRLANGLDDPTSLSFPGLRGPNATLGVGDLTEPATAAGGRREIRFTPPDCGFNLYGPNLFPRSAAQWGAGLYGPLVVEEAAPPAVDLERIVLVSDWRPHGPALTVNSGLPPLTETAPPGARVRLRLANVSLVRVLDIVISGGAPLIVAIDGQPSAPFAPLRNSAPLAPGARFEFIVDLPREPAASVTFALRDEGAQTPRPLIVIRAEGEPLPPRPAFAGLPDNPRLPREIALERAQRATLELAGGGAAPYSINGVVFAGWAAKPAFALPRGAPATLTLVNRTAEAQALRLGGHVARQLHALDDGWEPYWRDILLVAPGKTVHAAFVADNPGRWPIESASQNRRDAGLGAWFQVI